MERPPYIDEIMTSVRSNREQAWDALLSVVRAEFSGAAAASLARLLGAAPARAAGTWPEPGAAIPGFAVERAHRPERLELRGRHRFSAYVLVFELDDAGPGGTRVRARTYAAFPGRKGRVYRAFVIGSRGHCVLVHRMLRRVAGRAERPID